jgi:peptide/nickel transport system substrate-binding protein
VCKIPENVAENLASRELRLVQKGRADIAFDSVPLNRLGSLRRRYPAQVHSDATQAASTYGVFFNTRLRPFTSREARQAVDYAIDRNVTRKLWRRAAADVTCQILPIGFPGYRPYCPYTIDPSRAGTYVGPDLALAMRLVRESHTRGERVTFWAWYAPWGRYITRVLNQLGYRASFRDVPVGKYYGQVVGPQTTAQIGLATWVADYPTADDFFSHLFTCNADYDFGGYCNGRVDSEVAQAADLQDSDAAAAAARWAQIDRQLTDRAIWAPLISGAARTTTFVGPRVADYTNIAFYGTVLSQLWIR